MPYGSAWTPGAYRRASAWVSTAWTSRRSRVRTVTDWGVSMRGVDVFVADRTLSAT